MVARTARSSSLVAPHAGLLLLLPLACTQGGPDTSTSALSGAYTVGPADTEATDGSAGTTADTDPTAGGSAGQDATGDDDGDPSCCQPAATPGCGSPSTEACVCTAEPACCQQVWSAACVDLAEQCGDPFCSAATGEPGDGTTGDPVPPLECDAAFGFMPQDPAPGVAFDVTFTDPVGLTYVGLRADGPGGASIEGSWVGVTGSGPFTWTYGYSGLAAGTWTFAFTHRESENGPDLVRATCDKQL